MNIIGITELLDDSKLQEIVTEIYEESGLYLDDGESTVPKENKTEKQAVCPYCQSYIEIGAETVYCGSCHLPYHKDCWCDNSGCAVFGCKSKESNNINNKPDAGFGFIDLTTEDLPETSAAFIRNSSVNPSEGGNTTGTSKYWTEWGIWIVISFVIILMLAASGC